MSARVCRGVQIAKARQAELAKKAAEEAEAARARLAADGGPLDDPYAEKRRLEKLQEAHDLALASEFLGGSGAAAGEAAAAAGGKVDVYVRVNAVPLTNEEEFKQFGVAVAKKVNEATGPRSTANAMVCYREIMRQAAERLSLDNLSDLIKTLEVAHNRKKQATAPKKAASKKGGRLNIERASDYDLGSDFADMGGEAAAAGTGSTYADADEFM